MGRGFFYFLSDEYFEDFPDACLMGNKECIGGQSHNRPCYFAFRDAATGLYWMIPFSSRLDKFKAEYNKKLLKYGRCDTIVFGRVLGYEKAFLIQNMCPASEKYIKNIYHDTSFKEPVRIDGVFEKQLVKKAKKMLSLTRQGGKFIFPDVLRIEQELLK